MNIGFFVNDVATEQPGYTTIRLAMAAVNLGHKVWLMGAGDMASDPDEHIRARARTVPKSRYTRSESFLADLHSPKKAITERITVDDLDILMLRNDPSSDVGQRAWAQSVGIIFGRVAMRHGVIVVNDPDGLSRAMNKMYLQGFPEAVRPKTLITRDKSEMRKFAEEQGGRIVLKPLQGSGGEGVFLVDTSSMSNFNQIVESISSRGYVIAQEYLPAATEGDTRLFLMNGQPLKHKGKFAAFRRIRSGDDMRSNIHAGGKLREAIVDDNMMRLAEMVRPKLVFDGMFLVGLDIVGDKLMEVNVFSPGGLGSAQKFEKVNFTHAVIKALERKVEYAQYYDRNFNNVEMATL
ncbi:MAG: glutathione synthase [Verrucomicrobia bacterium]|nr:glutathione synthase [Verrucomicrobiota bacterium]